MTSSAQIRINIADSLAISRFNKVCLIVIFSICSTGCGEMYTIEGNELSSEINKELIAKGLCKLPKECQSVLEMYGGHGNQVNFSIYAPNKLALKTVFQFLIERGIDITHGIPISVKVYPKSRDEYGNFNFNSKPSITLEIKP